MYFRAVLFFAFPREIAAIYNIKIEYNLRERIYFVILRR